ncbi:MAG: TnpV protein [Clostridia bacterium]|nr:TnpV protein [Clostridia bacterium]
MEKLIYDSSNGLWYELRGDYYIPCLSLPVIKPIGRWGRKHLRYLQDHRRLLYSTLLLNGKLNNYLLRIDHEAQELFDHLMTRLIEKEEITEQLKEQDQIAWVRAMNTVHNTAEEIVNDEVVMR